MMQANEIARNFYNQNPENHFLSVKQTNWLLGQLINERYPLTKVNGHPYAEGRFSEAFWSVTVVKNGCGFIKFDNVEAIKVEVENEQRQQAMQAYYHEIVDSGAYGNFWTWHKQFTQRTAF